MKYFLNLFRWPGLLFCALILFSAGKVHANPPAAPAGQTGAELRSLSGLGENFEVILKFPSFKTGSDVPLTAYVLDSVTNEPIKGAALSGGMSSGSESITVTFKDTPESTPGAYAGQVRVLSEKPYSWLFDISRGEKTDLVAIDGFKAGGDSGGTPAQASLEQKETGDGINLTPAEVAVFIAAFVVLQVAIVLFVRKRYPPNASAKDPR